jgi:hypothetical protein
MALLQSQICGYFYRVQNIVRKFLFGHSLGREYICLPYDPEKYPFRVLLNDKDITSRHILLGYKPLLIGIPGNDSAKEKIMIEFRDQTADKRRAFLHLQHADEMALEKSVLRLYKGVSGTHQFFNPLHKTTNDVRMRIRSLRKGNIRLEGNLYDQVRIAYSIPRRICVVTTGTKTHCNFFPTDLHGGIDENFYVDSLRIGGKASEQVYTFKNIVISEIDAPSFSEVYALAKNHMKDPAPVNEKNISGYSDIFGLPLLNGTIAYTELSHLSSIDHGIHRLHFLKIIHKREIFPLKKPLSHIHNYAAALMERSGIATDSFLR